jgi:hypothetical protein
VADVKKEKKLGKKELAGMLSQNLELMRKLAEKSGDKVMLASIDEQQKAVKDVMGEDRAIGPCFGCKITKMVSTKNFEYESSKWFMCPHKDLFCPKCLKAANDEVRKKRKEERGKKGKK